MKYDKLIKLSFLSRKLELLKLAEPMPAVSATPPPKKNPQLTVKLMQAFSMLSSLAAGEDLKIIEQGIAKNPTLKESWDRVKGMQSKMSGRPEIMKDIEEANRLAVIFWQALNNLETLSEKDVTARTNKIKDSVEALKKSVNEILKKSDTNSADNNATLSIMSIPATRKTLQDMAKILNASGALEDTRTNVLNVVAKPESKTALANIATGITATDILSKIESVDKPLERKPISTRVPSSRTRTEAEPRAKYKFKGKAAAALNNISKWFDNYANLIASSIRSSQTDKLVRSGLASKIGENQVDAVKKEIKKLTGK